MFQKNEDKYCKDVVIIGGGISGIGAVLQLYKQPSISWVLLEASDRIGGRLQCINLDGRKLDAGAYQFANYSEQSITTNQFYSLIHQGQFKLNIRDKVNKTYYFDEKQGEFSKNDLQIVEDLMQKFTEIGLQLVKLNPLISHKEALDHFILKGGFDKQSVEQKHKRLFMLKQHLLEQEDATQMQNLLASEIIEDCQYQPEFKVEDCALQSYPIPTNTYYEAVMDLIKNIPKENLKLNSQVISVTRIEQNAQNKYPVRIQILNEGKVYYCKKVICSVPLSVLKKKQIKFSPFLPDIYSQVIQDLGWGLMEKVVLAFYEPFWQEDTLRIQIAADQMGKFPHFINLSGSKTNNQSQQAHIIGCFVTGKYAKKLRQDYKNDKEIAEAAVNFLKNAYPKKELKLKDFYITNWNQRPYVQGSFAYLTEKTTMEKIQKVRESINNWLWFSGEYLYYENIGCAHGAFSLGSRAAKSIIRLYNQQKVNE